MVASEEVRRNVTPVRVLSVRDGSRTERSDSLATEEPLEIRAQGPGQEATRVAVTMRTPGGDFELAAGFLFTEGLVAADGIQRVAYCDDLDDEEQRYNVVTVSLTEPFDAERLSRNFYATSSCGVCGKASLDDIAVRCDVVPMGFTVEADTLVGLPERLRTAQRVFDRTGGLHAAGLFTTDGDVVTVREDVGRHNAVDKLVGAAARERALPLAGTVLVVSARASFEIVQKASVAGIPAVVAVGAPTSLAVDLAQESGITLVAFTRSPRFSVYARPDRLAP